MSEPLNVSSLTTADIANPARAQEIRSTPTPRQAYTTSNEPVRDTVADLKTDQPSVEPAATRPVQPGPLFPDDELHNFRARWDQIQTSFVDEPRQAVEQADSLVANAVKRIAEQFAAEREQLEKQWDRGESVNTEDLRQALKRYRAFFDRLLTL
jgi:hypothetical protein